MDKTFTIHQISRITGLSTHTLRYYEKMGLLEGVARNDHGYRQYDQQDILWIEFLICLRELGMPISEMKLYSDLRSKGSSTVAERRRMLESHQDRVKQQIKELKHNLKKIEDKISYYKTLE